MALVRFKKVEASENGRVVDVWKENNVCIGFQLAGMPGQVFTAAHCVSSCKPGKEGTMIRGEASTMYALSYQQFEKVDKHKLFSVSFLREIGAQQVRSWKSDIPSSGDLLQMGLDRKADKLSDVDGALLQLCGPLSGVVGLNPARWTTMFRPGAVFLTLGLPLYYEKEVGIFSSNEPQVAIYSANQDLAKPVTLRADTRSFWLPLVIYPGFSGGPICARRKDIVRPRLLDVIARPFLALLPAVQPPPQPCCPASTRQRGETRIAVDPATWEELDYPLGMFQATQRLGTEETTIKVLQCTVMCYKQQRSCFPTVARYRCSSSGRTTGVLSQCMGFNT